MQTNTISIGPVPTAPAPTGARSDSRASIAKESSHGDDFSVAARGAPPSKAPPSTDKTLEDKDVEPNARPESLDQAPKTSSPEGPSVSLPNEKPVAAEAQPTVDVMERMVAMTSGAFLNPLPIAVEPVSTPGEATTPSEALTGSSTEVNATTAPSQFANVNELVDSALVQSTQANTKPNASAQTSADLPSLLEGSQNSGMRVAGNAGNSGGERQVDDPIVPDDGAAGINTLGPVDAVLTMRGTASVSEQPSAQSEAPTVAVPVSEQPLTDNRQLAQDGQDELQLLKNTVQAVTQEMPVSMQTVAASPDTKSVVDLGKTSENAAIARAVEGQKPSPEIKQETASQPTTVQTADQALQKQTAGPAVSEETDNVATQVAVAKPTPTKTKVETTETNAPQAGNTATSQKQRVEVETKAASQPTTVEAAAETDAKKSNVETPAKASATDSIRAQQETKTVTVTYSSSSANTDSGSKKSETGSKGSDTDVSVPTVNAVATTETKAATAVEAPKAADAANNVDRTQLVRQVSDRIQLLAATRPKEGVVVHLDPPDMGSLSLIVKAGVHGVDASISASNDHVRKALEQSRSELGQSLQNRGITLNSVNVTSQNPGNGQGQGSSMSMDAQTARQQHNQQQGQSGNPGSSPNASTLTSGFAERTVVSDRQVRASRNANALDLWI